MNKKIWMGLGLLSCLGVASASVQASGFANQDATAAGVGSANAMVAGVADVSAAQYNPAAVAGLRGVQVQLNSAVELRNSSVIQAVGMPFNGGSNYKVQGLSAIWMPHEQDWGLSMALTRPFANHTSWFGSSTNIEVDRVSLDVVHALSSTLSLAYGLDMYQSRVQMTQTGAAAFSGRDKLSLGVNVSGHWKPAPFWQVGVVFRSGSKAKPVQGAQSVDLKLPETLSLGVSHDVQDRWRLEADMDYTHWSGLKNLNVQGGTIRHALALKNTLGIKLAANYYWLPKTTVRVGYAYNQGANSPTNFQAAVADQAGHRVSLGVGGDMAGVHVDLAYAYTFHSNLNASAPVATAGTYRDRKQTLAFSVSKSF